MTGTGVVCPTYTPSGHSLQIQSRNRRLLEFALGSCDHSVLSNWARQLTLTIISRNAELLRDLDEI